jgi:uncharacterized membrane protein
VALLSASGVGVVLAGLRIERTGNWNYLFLIWNLMLAWLPLIFAIGVHTRHQRRERSGWRLYGLAVLWLLFFPNAPYIFTDMIHTMGGFLSTFWEDFILVLLFGFIGFMLGFVSLYLMQAVVAERLGRRASWYFILGMAWLSGFAVYAGRFLRWNSWDVLMHPVTVSNTLGHIAANSWAEPTSLIFSALFAIFMFLGYLMLYALTHLQPRQTLGVIV